MKKRMFIFLIAVMALLFAIGIAAAQTDSAGNLFISDENAAQQNVERDLYWAGSRRSFTGYHVGKSFIAAGYDIAITESEIGGSLRFGGYTITLNGVDIADNITAAGYDLQMSGVTAAGVYLVGNTVYFNGTADHLSVAGNTVTLDGEIHGDVDIYAKNVNLGENLRVDGTLTVKSEEEPAVPSDANVGQLDFKVTETINDPEDIVEEVKEKKSSSGFGGFIIGLLGTCLLAALICLLLGAEQIGKPGKMLLSRPWPMLGTGFAGLFVIPGIIILLLFIRIGFPCVGLLALLFAIVCFYSLIYAGITLANALIPKLTDNKILNNVWISSIIGAAVFWLLRKIPVLGMILQAASVIYTLGYFLQVIFLRLRKDTPKPEKEPLTAVPQIDVLEKVEKPAPAGSAVPVNNQTTAESEIAKETASVPETETAAVTEESAESSSSDE